MLFRSRKRQTQPNPEAPRHRDAAAYALLEEARLRCEVLRAEAKTPAVRDSLHSLHRELGLAGLFASSNLPTAARLALLAEAHQRCKQTVTEESEPMAALAWIMRRAHDAVEHGLIAPGLSDHMRLADVHLHGASEILVDRLARASIQPRKASTLGPA